MTRFAKIAVRGGLVLALAASVAACDRSNNATPDGPVVVPPAARQEDQFGTAFGTGFRADNNSEPYSPAEGDIVAVSLDTEPATID
jgi:hypothetical protein